MATALKNRAEAGGIEEIPALVAGQNDDMPIEEEWNDPDPARFIFREIDFDMDSNGYLQFSFRNPALALPLPAGGIDAVIDALLAQPFSLRTADFLTGPLTSTRQTPLDLNVKDDPAFVIYRLYRPRNLEFSPTLKAMTHKDGAHRPHYGRLRHVNTQDRSAQPVADCKLIYLIASPPAVDYVHGFNFKVQLLQRPHFGDPNPRILEFSVDPDIRNPGGSES